MIQSAPYVNLKLTILKIVWTNTLEIATLSSALQILNQTKGTMKVTQLMAASRMKWA